MENSPKYVACMQKHFGYAKRTIYGNYNFVVDRQQVAIISAIFTFGALI